jgi:hypothetical protein
MSDTQSEFNSSIACLIRIDNILKNLNLITVQRQVCTDKDFLATVQANYALLVSLYKELITEMNKLDEIENHEHAYKHVTKLHHNEMMKFLKNKTIKTNFLQEYDMWEMELRKTARKKGLLIIDKQSMLSALGEE